MDINTVGLKHVLNSPCNRVVEFYFSNDFVHAVYGDEIKEQIEFDALPPKNRAAIKILDEVRKVFKANKSISTISICTDSFTSELLFCIEGYKAIKVHYDAATQELTNHGGELDLAKELVEFAENLSLDSSYEKDFPYAKVAKAVALATYTGQMVVLTKDDRGYNLSAKSEELPQGLNSVSAQVVHNLVYLFEKKGYKSVTLTSTELQEELYDLTIKDIASGKDIVGFLLSEGVIVEHQHVWYDGEMKPINYFSSKNNRRSLSKLINGYGLRFLPTQEEL